MEIRIALAGNPNSGKTTLFNALTGSNQFVGNWPGVTVEKKEGRFRKNGDVVVTDLPGIYSLSPYSPEEVVSRDFLTEQHPDVILNIVDGTNLERNLYLTTQLAELGIPMVVAVNMIDVVRKNGDEINVDELSLCLGCPVYEISALKGIGISEVSKAAIDAAGKSGNLPKDRFSEPVENALTHIEEIALHNLPENKRRWFAIKLFERDRIVYEKLSLDRSVSTHIEKEIKAVEAELEDDAESIITGERYSCISSMIMTCLKKKKNNRLSQSDKIDRIVTNRWLGLPIFAAVMFLVYYISMVSVGQFATDWANDGLFGDGWHLFGIGTAEYESAAEAYGDSDSIIEAFASEYGEGDILSAVDTSSDEYDGDKAEEALERLVERVPEDSSITYKIEDEETLEVTVSDTVGLNELKSAVAEYLSTEYKQGYGAPAASEYGIWVPGIPVIAENALDSIGTADWLKSLVIDGIIAGVGAVLGFVPQMLVLFLLLAFLEACGYMARIAFVLDRIFRKFGLSGKSFIPMLVGMGCGVPGIMASRTIENERDRRMTIMTTTFIPCGAKVPFIGMIAGAIFGGSPWVATSAYFIGMASVVISGIILKKTRMFSGEPAPFVMELPAYRLPTVRNMLSSMWERGWSFIRKAGTIILLSTVVIWFTTYFGFIGNSFTMLGEDQLDSSILAAVCSSFAWIFKPLGFGTWEATVASVTGLVAKENIVGTLGILYGVSGDLYGTMASVFDAVSGYSFLAFNLLCAPCFAAIGAIKREMNNPRWTFFAIAYQCGFAYSVALMINQFGSLFAGRANAVGVIAALAVLAVMLYLLLRPSSKPTAAKAVKKKMPV